MRNLSWVTIALPLILWSAQSAATAAHKDQTSADISALRGELLLLKSTYANQIAQLEARLAQAESTLASHAAPPSASALPSELPTPSINIPQRMSNALNPDVSLVLIGAYAAHSTDPDRYAAPGFVLPEEAGPGVRGLSLGESELTLSANVDDKFYGAMTAALSVEDGETALNLEEAYVQTTALPYGLTFKGGRFFSRIGYLNEQHAHADDFVDRPLPYKIFLNGNLGDDGAQLRWLAPLDQFVEFGAEAYRGDSFPAHGALDHGVGTYTFFSHLGDDLSDDWSYRVGGSYVHAEVGERATGELPDLFDGTSELAIADVIFKWAPNGNPAERNLKLQAEYFRRWESGLFNATDYDGTQDGFYLQTVYQFQRRWRIGARFDRLLADNTGVGVAGTVLDTLDHDPSRVALLLEFDNSEFSRLRLQYGYDDSSHATDHQLLLNYIYSLGAHGAHQF